jgi:hypothetical protein
VSNGVLPCTFQAGVTSIRQNDGADHMKKLSVLGIIGGAALLTAAPVSLQWTQKNVALSLDSAEARIGRPGTALSVAGVHRRSYRRAVRRTVYGAGAAAAVGYGFGGYYGGYGGYGYPAYSYSAPYAPATEQATVMGRTTAATAIRATPPHLTIPALLSASGGVTRLVQLPAPLFVAVAHDRSWHSTDVSRWARACPL